MTPYLQERELILKRYYTDISVSLNLLSGDEYWEQQLYQRGEAPVLNYLETFLRYTDLSESPRSFFIWSALTSISAVARDNIFLEWNYGITYPNIYVLLVAPPALGKKHPMVIAGDLIKKAGNTKVIEGRTSMPAVARELGTFRTGEEKGSSCIIYSEELSSLFAGGADCVDLLTDLWDFHKKWPVNLISWQTTLVDTCITLYAATNETLLKTVFDPRALYGGLLSRTIVVIEKRKRRKDSMGRKAMYAEHELDYKCLEAHLKNLSKKKGTIRLDDEAYDEFNNWYMNQWSEDNPKTKTGIEGRMKTHVMKVSMLLSLCEWDLEMVIRKKHVDLAIELCTKLYKNYQLISMEGGTSPTAHPAALMLRMLRNSPNNELPRTTILRRNIGEMNVTVLDEVVNSMKEAELLIETNCSNVVAYRLTEKALELLEESESKKK